jgi:ACS family glucarate transporter-like MFS transporter
MESGSVSLSEVKVASAVWPARYTLVVFMLVAYVIAWSDRIGFSVSAPRLMGEFGWSRTQMGIALSAFTWGFTVFKLPAGWLADRFGGVRTMIGGILFWSVVTLLFPLTSSLLLMAGLRFFLGIGEITYPPSQIKILSRWFPDSERPKVNGICLAASSMANVLATPLAAGLLVAYDWHMVFFVFGGIGILWGLGLWRWSSNPETLSRLNEQSEIVAADDRSKTTLSWRRLLKLRVVWGLVAVYICLTYCFWMFLNWLPTYLIEARRFTFLQVGFYSILPAIAQGTSQIAVGWLSPYLLARGFSKNFSRKVIICGGFLGASVFMILVVVTLSPILAVVYIGASMALLGACYTPIWTIPTDLSAKWPGTIFGFAGTLGFLGGASAPIVTGYIVDHTGSWHYAFYLASAISLLGFLAAWLLVSTDSVDSRLEAAAAR